MKFDLDKLHWREFELLAGMYLKSVIGEGVIVFSGSRDKGRDATFSGKANAYPSESNPAEGLWIFQCKHHQMKNSTLRRVENKLISDLGAELNKIFIKHNFQCENYVFITNVDLSNDFSERASTLFKKFCGQNDVYETTLFLVDYKDIAFFLAGNRSARYAFPPLLQFVDLEKIFLKKEEVRNKGFLKSAYQQMGSFVSTKHFQDAIDKISDLGFLMLVGNAKSGKTSIVEAIALAFLDESDFLPYFIKTADEFFAIVAYLPEDQNALFICDDIFGRHDLDRHKLREWEDYFQSVMGNIGDRFKFLFTTRQYIYRQFVNRSGLDKFFPNDDDPSRFRIKLVELGIEEREQILEKHLAVSALKSEVVRLVSRMKSEILSCKDFSPEVIRSLVSILEHTDADELADVITNHISNPNKYLYDFFDNIDTPKKLFLISLSVSLGPEEKHIEESYNSVSGDFEYKSDLPFRRILDELTGSIVKRRDYLSSTEFEYFHPSMYEVILNICKEDLGYRTVVLKNANLDILGLLTILSVEDEESHRIQIGQNEISLLRDSMSRIVRESDTISNVTSSLRWIKTIMDLEIPKAFDLQSAMKNLQGYVANLIQNEEFYSKYRSNNVGRWIKLLDVSRFIMRSRRPVYFSTLAAEHVDYLSYEYWSLIFIIESISLGFIEQQFSPEVLNEFLDRLSDVIAQLEKGLNFHKGRPKTQERWVPLFSKCNRLIGKMKASGTGRRILEDTRFNGWNIVIQYSDFAKNRHRGMANSGYWKPYIDPSTFTRLDETLVRSIGGIPICPACESLMVIRTARSGANPGSQFYGCSRYPDCTETMPIM